jgi:predicted transglutaminase-like cysteine proteinase
MRMPVTAPRLARVRPVCAFSSAVLLALAVLSSPATAATSSPFERASSVPSQPAVTRSGVPVDAAPQLRLAPATRNTPLARRWARTRARLDAELAWLVSCERGACRDPRAVDWGRMRAHVAAAPAAARPALVQAGVVRRIRYRADAPEDDHWATPLATLARGAGDCEDIAILKYALLRAGGVAEADLGLMVLATAGGGGHVALLVGKERPLVLDNRFRRPRPASALAGDRLVALLLPRGFVPARDSGTQARRLAATAGL